jgi:ligand-binding SRPBCC domain-containing protein
MPTIHLTTFIAAPVSVVFDLSRHIGVHKEAMSDYKEDAVAGTRFGLIEKDETVTWRAKHLFKERLQRMKIVEMIKTEMFVESQLSGDLTSYKHEHHFKACENGMLLIDLLTFETPYGILGKWFNTLYLTGYIETLLQKRNLTIKKFAESGRWKNLLIK